MEVNYPQIDKLGLKIRNKPVSHILREDLEKVLTETELEKFSEYFGVQTCLLTDDGKAGMYPWDVEAVLVLMFTGRRIGTQLNWD